MVLCINVRMKNCLCQGSPIWSDRHYHNPGITLTGALNLLFSSSDPPIYSVLCSIRFSAKNDYTHDLIFGNQPFIHQINSYCQG